MPLSVLALFISVAMQNFLPESNLRDFLISFVIGLGMVILVYQLILEWKGRRKD